MKFRRCNKFSRPENEFEAFFWAYEAMHEALQVIGNVEEVGAHNYERARHALDTSGALHQYYEDMVADKLFAMPKPDWKGSAPDDSLGVRPDAALERAFDLLAYSLEHDIRIMLSSNRGAEASHPAFKAIVAMGEVAVPWVLKHWLEIPEGASWCAVLQEITGENPVPEAHYGRYDAIREAWLKWGRDKKII